DEVKNRAENKVVNKAGNATDKAIDKADQKASNAVKGSKNNSSADSNSPDDDIAGATSPKTKAKVKTNYASYDFVPGDKIIFQPDLSGEADAELPARFILKKGNAEIQSYEGEKILHLNAGGYVTVTPLMDNNAYLPEQFTLEFDMMYENDKDYFAYTNDFMVRFYGAGDEIYDGYGLGHFSVDANEATALGKYRTSRNRVSEAVALSFQTNDA